MAVSPDAGALAGPEAGVAAGPVRARLGNCALPLPPLVLWMVSVTVSPRTEVTCWASSASLHLYLFHIRTLSIQICVPVLQCEMMAISLGA